MCNINVSACTYKYTTPVQPLIHVLMRDERRKEERSKQGQTNKQGKATHMYMHTLVYSLSQFLCRMSSALAKWTPFSGGWLEVLCRIRWGLNMIRTRTCTHTHTHAHACTHTHTHAHVHTHTHAHVHTHACTYTHTRTISSATVSLLLRSLSSWSSITLPELLCRCNLALVGRLPLGVVVASLCSGLSPVPFGELWETGDGREWTNSRLLVHTLFSDILSQLASEI